MWGSSSISGIIETGTYEVVEILNEHPVDRIDVRRRDRQRQRLDGDVDELVYSEMLLHINHVGD